MAHLLRSKTERAELAITQIPYSKCRLQKLPVESQMVPNSETRAIYREKYEIVRDFAHQCTASEYNPTAQSRPNKVEMLCAHLKCIPGLGRLRLSGPCGVQDEFTLAAIARNLQKLAKLKPKVPVAG